MSKSVRYLTHAAIIAALYVVLTHLSNAFGLASGVIQLRISEALTILQLQGLITILPRRGSFVFTPGDRLALL